MKLLIPPAKKVFKTVQKKLKEPSFEQKFMEWLNTIVYEKIMSTQPSLSTILPLKVYGVVYVDTPDFYRGNENDFKRIAKAKLAPIGYDVEFTWSDVGDICIIKWENLA